MGSVRPGGTERSQMCGAAVPARSAQHRGVCGAVNMSGVKGFVSARLGTAPARRGPQRTQPDRALRDPGQVGHRRRGSGHPEKGSGHAEKGSEHPEKGIRASRNGLGTTEETPALPERAPGIPGEPAGIPK